MRLQAVIAIPCAVMLWCGVPVVAAAQEPTAAPLHVMRLAPIAFMPANEGVRYVVEEGGLGRLCLTKGAGYFIAIVHLPDGATIDRIAGVVEDANPKSMGMLSLVRRTPDKSDVLAMTTVSSDDHPSEELSANTIQNAVVDNERYTYLLQAVLTGPGVCLRGASVSYH